MRRRFAATAWPLHLGEDVTAMFNEAVAVYFRELREGQGFTQESLADVAGCSKRTIERIERNEGPVTMTTLERLMAEGEALDEEAVCALALERPAPRAPADPPTAPSRRKLSA